MKIVLSCFVLTIIFLWAGCVYQPVRFKTFKDELLDVNFNDGISKEEAITLAKKYLIEKGYTNKWSLKDPYAYYNQPTKEWFVEFGSKYYFFSEGRYSYTLRVIISADLGIVKSEAFCRYQ
jgi:hypothetical protein